MCGQGKFPGGGGEKTDDEVSRAAMIPKVSTPAAWAGAVQADGVRDGSSSRLQAAETPETRHEQGRFEAFGRPDVVGIRSKLQPHAADALVEGPLSGPWLSNKLGLLPRWQRTRGGEGGAVPPRLELQAAQHATELNWECFATARPGGTDRERRRSAKSVMVSWLGASPTQRRVPPVRPLLVRVASDRGVSCSRHAMPCHVLPWWSCHGSAWVPGWARVSRGRWPPRRRRRCERRIMYEAR